MLFIALALSARVRARNWAMSNFCFIFRMKIYGKPVVKYAFGMVRPKVL